MDCIIKDKDWKWWRKCKNKGYKLGELGRDEIWMGDECR